MEETQFYLKPLEQPERLGSPDSAAKYPRDWGVMFRVWDLAIVVPSREECLASWGPERACRVGPIACSGDPKAAGWTSMPIFAAPGSRARVVGEEGHFPGAHGQQVSCFGLWFGTEGFSLEPTWTTQGGCVSKYRTRVATQKRISFCPTHSAWVAVAGLAGACSCPVFSLHLGQNLAWLEAPLFRKWTEVLIS